MVEHMALLGDVRDAHVAKMRFYASKELHLRIFQHFKLEATFHITRTDCKKAPKSDEYLVLVK